MSIKISKHLTQPVHIAPLVVYRIVFGLALAYSALRMIVQNRIAFNYDTLVKFHYYGFEWITPLPYHWYLPVYISLIVAGVCIALGLFYRFSTTYHFLAFTYLELIDKSYYLNHYYFVSLMCFLHIFLPSHRYFSLDSYFHPKAQVTHVPNWIHWVVKGQISIVYVYAGLCKINSDWLLEAQPLKIWLPPNDDLPIIGPLFRLEITPYLFSWLGMLFDLTIPFWLNFRKTRFFAYVAVLIFHTITGLMFPIGIFPLVMSIGALIFFSENFHIQVIRILSCNLRTMTEDRRYWHPASFKIKMLKFIFIIYFVFQLLFPWRYLLYPGRLFWTEQGYRFSWRVMLTEKYAYTQFYVVHPITKHRTLVDNSQFLKDWQENQMSFQPDFILQYARFLASYYEPIMGIKPMITADVKISVNGRPMTPYFSPDLDLTTIKDSWENRDWLYPAPW